VLRNLGAGNEKRSRLRHDRVSHIGIRYWLHHNGGAMTQVELEATELNHGLYAVRPKGQLGTCGFYPVPWEVVYVQAKSAEKAIERARQKNV